MAQKVDKLVRGSNAALMTLAIVGSLVLVNLLAARWFARADLTEEGIYTLSDSSISLVRNLDDTVRVKAYFSEALPPEFGPVKTYLRDLLDEYRAHAHGKFRYEFIDPKDDEDIKKELQTLGIPEREVQVARNDAFEATRAYMGIALHYGDKHEVIPTVGYTVGLEYDITSLVKKLTRERIPEVGILKGKGGPNPEEAMGVAAGLIGQQYKNRFVDLGEGEIANDLDALIIVSPTDKFDPSELYKLDQFLMKGKTIAFLLDMVKTDTHEFTAQDVSTDLDLLLASYGAEPQKNLVLDAQNARINVMSRQGFMQISQTIAYPYFPLIMKMPDDNPITRNISGLSFPFVSEVKVTAVKDGPIKADVLAQSSAKSWVETGSYPIHPMMRRETEPTFDGPHVMAATLRGKFKSYFADRELPEGVTGEPIKESPETRILVVGDGDFILDEGIARDPAKRAFFENMLDWLVQDDALVGIRSKRMQQRPIEEITDGKKAAIKYGNMFAVPLAFALMGVVWWRMRESRRRGLAI